MPDFNTTLQREKFVITEKGEGSSDADSPEQIMAFSNRMEFSLQSADGKKQETFVVRAQVMHVCIRFAAFLVKEYERNGSIMMRDKSYDWSHAYRVVTHGYEETWNDGLWVAVYHKGRNIYAAGNQERHPFLDVIEQCDASNAGTYESSVLIAEEAFEKAGKAVNIEHDVHVALVSSIKNDVVRCGLVSRAANKTTTFSFTMRPADVPDNKKTGRAVLALQVPRVLSLCAAFLEGMQLAFLVGMTLQRQEFGIYGSSHPEAKQGREASKRLSRLRFSINVVETESVMNYRPERPSFGGLIEEAQEFARTNLDIVAETERAAQLEKAWAHKIKQKQERRAGEL